MSTAPNTDDIAALLGKLQRQADAFDVDLAAVHDHLGQLLQTGEVPTKATAGQQVPTLRAWITQAERHYRGELTATLRTYRCYWTFLAEGLRLYDTVPKGDSSVQQPWPEQREEEWLEHAAAVIDDRGYGFDLDDIARDADTGILIVWPGLGSEKLYDIGALDFGEAIDWQRVRTLAEARRRDKLRAAQGRPRCGWTGDGAVEDLISATRALYRLAEQTPQIPDGHNPAAAVAKPERSPSPRGTLSQQQLADVHATAATTGNDPELDRLLIYFHLLTGARQEGAWRLRLRHLDWDLQAIAIPDKNSQTKRGGDSLNDKIPVPAYLLEDLSTFAASRGSTEPDDFVFRQKHRDRRTGELHPPLTRRRYNTLYKRIRKQHEWARKTEFGVHWLRHHASAVIEGIAGRPGKMRFLRHKPNGQTDLYGQAGFKHLAWAIASWTRTPHPMAEAPPHIVTNVVPPPSSRQQHAPE